MPSNGLKSKTGVKSTDAESIYENLTLKKG